MTDFRVSPWFRLALVGAFAASLALAGCGRKGPLDPPPAASLAGQPQASVPGLTTNPSAQSVGGRPADTPAIGPDGRPVAPKGPKKHIPLDVLLN